MTINVHDTQFNFLRGFTWQNGVMTHLNTLFLSSNLTPTRAGLPALVRAD
jgi:hypothetical protein